MTNEVVNVPELRFTGFEDEWKKKKLDDVANYRRGSFPQPYGNKEWYDEKNGEPFVQVVDVDKNMKLHDRTKQKISDLAKPKSVKGFKGDIVVTLQGSIGRVALLHYDAYIDRTLLLIYSFKIEMNKNYFKYVLYLLFLKEKERAPGGTIKTITKKVLSNFKIDIPNVGEQEKIGEFFSKLDRQIELEEQKLAKLEEQKKGYMQKIFSQELRFKDEKGNTFEEWKNTNFNYFMSEPDNLEKGIVLRKDQLLTVKLGGNGVSKANINRALKMGSTVYYKRFAGQFIYGKQNFFNGAFGIVPKFLNNYYSSGDVPALNIDYSKIDSKYFINYISRKDYYKKKEAFSTGTGSKRIHEKTLLDFDIMLPSVEEQEKIGDFFSEIDNFIEKQSYKVELLKERKKGFLQKMFV